MSETNLLFHEQSISLVQQLWQLFVTDPVNPNINNMESIFAANAVIIGMGKHDFYKNLHDFLAAAYKMTAFPKNISLEIIDEWYEVQAIEPEICIVYGSLWLRQETTDDSNAFVDMDTRFTVSCKNTLAGPQILNFHHSLAKPDRYIVDLDVNTENGIALPEEITRQMEQDALTGLYNRMTLIENIKKSLLHSENTVCALFMVDIDGFKHINDTLGHIFGDSTLKEIADHINHVFRKSDIKGRLGGDEFMILLLDVPSEQLVLQRAASLCQEVASITSINGQELSISCSIGIAFYPRHGYSFEDLYERADAALYQAKAFGKNQYIVYENQMEHPAPSISTAEEQTKIKPLEEKWKLLRYKLHKSKKNRIIAVTLLFLFLISSFSAVCAQYLSYMKEMTRQDSKAHLEEISNQIALQIYRDISNNLSAVEQVAKYFPDMHFPNDDALGHTANAEMEYWKFADLGFVNRQGYWLHADGTKTFTKNSEFIKNITSKGTMILTNPSPAGNESVLFSAPLAKPLRVQGEEYVIAIAVFDLHAWDELAQIDAFSGQASIRIVQGDGTYIIRANDNTDYGFSNYFDKFVDVSFEDGITSDSIKNDMLIGNSGYVSYEKNGINAYLTYTAIGFRDWYVVSTVKAETVDKSTNILFASTVIICIALSCLFSVILAIFAVLQYQTRKKLLQTTYVDTITSGANKNKFELDVKTLLQNKTNYTLVYSNIRQFKALNDRFGKEEADNMLRQVYQLFLDILSHEECCGRLSSDNFGLLLHTDAGQSVDKRLTQLAARCAVLENEGGMPYGIQMTFGYYEIKYESEDFTHMLDKANIAMKSAPPDAVCTAFLPEMLEKLKREKTLVDAIPQALKNKEFVVYLQPSVGLKTQKILGAEALVRWISPQKGMILPAEFIPLAERSSLIKNIDLFVFESVCKMLQKWISHGLTPVTISFNLSRAQLSNPNFLDSYKEIIAKYQTPPQYLKFEFTETLIYENMELLNQAAEEIKQMGALCAIDDFGNGYSSLGLLSQLKTDTLKLDRSFFLPGATDENRSKRVVEAVIKLGQSLGMTTIAEGAETKEQVQLLTLWGCDAIQGYVFYQPMPIPEFEALLFGEDESAVLSYYTD